MDRTPAKTLLIVAALLLMALGLMGAFGWSLAVGLAAALIRELAAPYLLLMAVMALHEHRRREALAWTLALAAFALTLGLHGWLVGLHTLPTDGHSQGWLAMGGWPFVLHALQWNAVLAAGPAWLAAVLVPLALALAGAAVSGGRLGLIVLGYACALLLFGRPENAYWGLVLTPLLPLCLVRLPMALARRPGEARAWALAR